VRRSAFVLATLSTLCLLLFQAGCDLEGIIESSDRYREDFQYSFDLKPGGRLVVENFNGSIEIIGWEKQSVQITGTKYAGREEMLRELRIETRADANSVVVRTVRPSGYHGNMGARYSIRVPRQVRLERIASSNGQIRVEDIQGEARLETSNGTVVLRRIEGRVDAHTSNGRIEADSVTGDMITRTSNGSIRLARITGAIEANTSNSSIVAQISKPRPAAPLRFESSNGSIEVTLETLEGNDVRASTSNSSITVRLPESVKARLRASTSNGSISSDFDVTMRGAMSKNHLEGQINGGGPLIDLSSSNGAIRILRQ